MRNTFSETDNTEKAFMEMKHHFTNVGLMALLIALLAVPMTGFYALNYSTETNDGLQIPDYIPVTGLNSTDVLSAQSTNVAETSNEILTPKELKMQAKMAEDERIRSIDKVLDTMVLGSSDEASVDVAEGTAEVLPTIIQNVELSMPNSEITPEDDSLLEDFDPAQYQPANIYPVYR